MERSAIQEAGVSPDSALLHLGYVVASMHSFSVDTAVACAMRTKNSGVQGKRARTEPLTRIPGTAAGARYSDSMFMRVGKFNTINRL